MRYEFNATLVVDTDDLGPDDYCLYRCVLNHLEKTPALVFIDRFSYEHAKEEEDEQ